MAPAKRTSVRTRFEGCRSAQRRRLLCPWRVVSQGQERWIRSLSTPSRTSAKDGVIGDIIGRGAVLTLHRSVRIKRSPAWQVEIPGVGPCLVWAHEMRRYTEVVRLDEPSVPVVLKTLTFTKGAKHAGRARVEQKPEASPAAAASQYDPSDSALDRALAAALARKRMKRTRP
jgi:hypothetical protein